MNRVFTSIVMTLGIVGSAAAQTTNNMSQQSEIIELSSYTDGNYNVEQLLVMESTPSNSMFKVRYKINLTNFISTYDNNSEEITGLRRFIESVQQDSLRQITRFDIVGYSSPDGPTAFNDKIAKARANDFARYFDKEYSMSGTPRSVTGKVSTWSDARSAISSSSTPNKSEVLSAIDSGTSQAMIQSKIEALPTAWSYIKREILPPMRCVEITVEYSTWKMVENRTAIEEVVPIETQAQSPQTVVVDMRGNRRRDNNYVRRYEDSDCCDEEKSTYVCNVTDDYINCILIEMPGQPFDFGEECDTEKEKFKERMHGKKGKMKLKEKEKKGRRKGRRRQS